MPGSSILADDVDVSMQDEEKMASDDADGGEGGEQGQTQHQRGRSSDNENNREAEQEIIRAKREQTASRAEEAMRRLLEGPSLETIPAVSWTRLGLSLASSRELHELRASMMKPQLELAKQPKHDDVLDATADEGAQEGKESSHDARVRAHKHESFLRQHLDTFIAYKWMLQALLRRAPGANGGCQVQVADVILFTEGDPQTWIFTNKGGCIDSRNFVATGDTSMWPRFLKTARRAAGVSKDDRESNICIRFTSSVEGVAGDLMSMSELQEFIKEESANRHQVVGLQVVVGPKCGYRRKPSEKTILYKTEYQRESSISYTFKHIKEYDVQYLGKAGAGDMNSPAVKLPATGALPDEESETAEAKDSLGALRAGLTSLGLSPGLLLGDSIKSSLGPLNAVEEDVAPEAEQAEEQHVGEQKHRILPWHAKRQVVQSQALNRPLLGEITARCVKYIERSRGILLQGLRGHFVEDSANRVWMVGVSRIFPFVEDEIPQDDVAADAKLQVDPSAARLTKSIQRMQEAAAAVLEAVKMPPSQRKEKVHQLIFAEMRSNHFLDQLPTVWQSEIAKTVEYKFVECGLEVYYNKAVLDEFYIIIQGSVRLILEPTNTTYCRTVDLTDKDTFAEQVITKPGTQMQSQAVALEDTHLMVVKRSAVEAVINRGKKLDRARWHLTKRQVDKCRRIFGWDPAVRNVLDTRQAMESTINCEFFQNISPFLHMELCAKATFRVVEPGKPFFEQLAAPPAFFVLVLRGRLTWTYHDQRTGEKAVDIGDSQYLSAVGTAINTSVRNVEAIVIPREHWERCSQPQDESEGGMKKAVHHSKDAPATSFFLTELDESADNRRPATLKPSSRHSHSEAHSVAGSHHSASMRGPLETDAPNAEKSSDDRGAKGTDDWQAVPFGDLFPRSREDQLAVQKERHVTCTVTGIRFPASKQKILQRRQVMETARHLRDRRSSSKGFLREKWLTEPKSRLALFDTVVVCPGAFDAFVMEKNLHDQEKIFAKTLMNMSMPALSERTLPPSGSAKMTTQLLLMGMFVEFVKLESPEALLQFGNEFEVHFSLCGHAVSMKFEVLKRDIPPGGAPLFVNKVRMSWFFSSDEGITVYLKKQAKMEFSVFNCETGEQFAAMKVDLSDLANKVALQQSIRVPIEPTHKDLASVLALQYAYLHINIGCIKSREVDASSFRLRRRHGLYLPSTPFITECLPPDGWDPCNEEYIREFAKGDNFLEVDATALTMEGALIPRSRKIQHLIQADLDDDGTDSIAGDAKKIVSKYLRLSDGIAPAPIWQRKNHGALPPKHPESGRPPRPVSAPVENNKINRRPKARTRAASASQLRVSSPSASLTPGKRRPSSSPVKRFTPGPFSRPSSSVSRARASESLTPTRSRVRRPESAPPRADRAFEESSQRGRSAGGRSSISTVYQRPSVGGSGAQRPTSAFRRPASAKMPDRRPSSALAAARQRPNSALGKMASSNDSRSRSPTSRSLMARPDSAMSNMAPSSADEYDIIDTIDELDQAEWERGISPFEFRDDGVRSNSFGFLRTSSTTSAISGNFGVCPSHRRPASAMAAAGGMGEEETEEANALVLAAITRPRSAATSSTAKCVEGLRNQMPSFQSACAVSKLAELVGKPRKRSVMSTDILTTVETNHKAWRSKITEISTLDDDLKALDARSRLIAFRERTTYIVAPT